MTKALLTAPMAFKSRFKSPPRHPAADGGPPDASSTGIAMKVLVLSSLTKTFKELSRVKLDGTLKHLRGGSRRYWNDRSVCENKHGSKGEVSRQK